MDGAPLAHTPAPMESLASRSQDGPLAGGCVVRVALLVVIELPTLISSWSV